MVHHERAPLRRRGLWVGVAIATFIASTGLVAAPAAAVPSPPTTTTYEYVSWNCGYPMTVHGTLTRDERFRSDATQPDIVYRSETYRLAETWTNADGAWFSLSAHGVMRDGRATSLGDNLYRLSFQTSGQPQVITDDEGVVVARDRGVVRYEFTIDFTSGAFNLLDVQVGGPHPGLESEFCKLVAPLVGTTSAEHQTARPLGTTDAPMGYFEYLPPSYEEDGAASPLLIATNGYGENGDGSPEALTNLLFTGIPRFIDVGGWPLERPLVVLSTQHVETPPGFDFSSCETPEVIWVGSCAMQRQHDLGHAAPTFCTTPGELQDFIDFAVAEYNVDPDRVYLTGLSCGAFGVWEYLAVDGGARVAAAVPIAGEGRPAWTDAGCALGDVPIWAFHGELDEVVDPLGSIEPMTSLAACPGVDPDRARLTVFPGVDHLSWDAAYSGSEGDDIYGWMLQYARQ